MADTFVISGLREKGSATAGQIVEWRRRLDRLQADLFHIDAVLRLYDVEPSEIPAKRRAPVRSAHFGRNENRVVAAGLYLAGAGGTVAARGKQWGAVQTGDPLTMSCARPPRRCIGAISAGR